MFVKQKALSVDPLFLTFPSLLDHVLDDSLVTLSTSFTSSRVVYCGPDTGNPQWGDEEETVRIETNEHNNAQRSTLCLIGKILTDKSLNAYVFLETMKKAMKPANGFIVKEVGQNLFSFQFRSETDLREVLAREPWHFDKHLLVLKELDMGE
ncbi:hypothetical protein ACS0TY_014215 [Phlomoides rotata]